MVSALLCSITEHCLSSDCERWFKLLSRTGTHEPETLTSGADGVCGAVSSMVYNHRGPRILLQLIVIVYSTICFLDSHNPKSFVNDRLELFCALPDALTRVQGLSRATPVEKIIVDYNKSRHTRNIDVRSNI